MDFKQQAADQAVQHTSTFVGSKLATGMTYGGGATAFIGGLTLNDAHRIVSEAEDRIRAARPGADVLIHADPHGGATAVPATQ